MDAPLPGPNSPYFYGGLVSFLAAVGFGVFYLSMMVWMLLHRHQIGAPSPSYDWSVISKYMVFYFASQGSAFVCRAITGLKDFRDVGTQRDLQVAYDFMLEFGFFAILGAAYNLVFALNQLLHTETTTHPDKAWDMAKGTRDTYNAAILSCCGVGCIGVSLSGESVNLNVASKGRPIREFAVFILLLLTIALLVQSVSLLRKGLRGKYKKQFVHIELELSQRKAAYISLAIGVLLTFRQLCSTVMNLGNLKPPETVWYLTIVVPELFVSILFLVPGLERKAELPSEFEQLSCRMAWIFDRIRARDHPIYFWWVSGKHKVGRHFQL